MCESLKQSPITQISTISENITHLIQYGQEKTKEIHDELNGNNQSINNLKDQETVLKNQISKLKSSLSSSSYLRLCQDVCVRFVTSEKVVQTMIDDLGITLTYFVSGAKWSASYDVRVNSVTREMMVNYFVSSNDSSINKVLLMFRISNTMSSSIGLLRERSFKQVEKIGMIVI